MVSAQNSRPEKPSAERHAAAAALLGGSRLVDCTQTITPSTFSFVGCFFDRAKFQRETLTDTRTTAGYMKERFTMACDVGTHIDAPLHWYRGTRSIASLAVDELVAPGAVVDVTESCEGNSDYLLSVEDLEAWEGRHGPMPPNALVVMKTGWGSKVGDTAAYLGLENFDGEKVQPPFHFPGFSSEAADWLLQKETGIVGIGIDTASLDAGCTSTYPVHAKVLGADKYQIENLKLDDVPESGITFVALPIKIADAPEAEARVVAVLS